MKKILSRLLLLPLFAVALAGCQDEPLVFDHEKPQFETRNDAILLEVLLPSTSSDTDSYYIVGDFNGGKNVAVGDAEWQLTKASTGVAKWGIYLDPTKFVEGKTLADGFTFYSEAQGQERSANNEQVTHSLDVSIGSRSNVWVSQWEAFFSGEKPRDFSRVYLYNQRGWEAIALYYHGDANVDPWPGIQPTGTETIDGIPFTYFDLDPAINGMVVNLIPNNNNGGEQIEDESVAGWTVEGDFYLALTAAGGVRMDPDNLVIPYDGHKVYINNQSGWDDLALFAWHNYSPVDAEYPGWQAKGTEVINNVEYTYFELPESMNDKAFSLVFNNNKPASSPDRKEVQGPVIEMFSEEVYYTLTDGAFEVTNPFGVERKIYVENLSDWAEVALHYWGDGLTGTNWPGIQPSGTETVGDAEYTVFTLPADLDGKAINFILNNNNNGVQLTAYYLENINKDYFFRIPADPVNEATAPEEFIPGVQHKVYVENFSDWTEISLHYWIEGTDVSTAWPGLQPSGTEEIGEVTYAVFTLPADLDGKSPNFILNNNGAGEQLANGYLNPVNRDFFYRIPVDKSAPQEIVVKIYVDDQTGWDALTLHYWGDGIEGTAWPGITPIGTEDNYTIFELPAELTGKSLSWILNNNGAGAQFDGSYIPLVRDYYFTATATGATEVE
jgi:hypothetical protein